MTNPNNFRVIRVDLLVPSNGLVGQKLTWALSVETSAFTRAKGIDVRIALIYCNVDCDPLANLC